MKYFLGACILAMAMSVAAKELPITAYAKSADFHACLSTVTDLEKFFGKGINYGHWTKLATETTNKQPLNTSIELSFKDGIHLIDFTVTPTPDGACSYAYTRTWYADKPCLAVSKEEFLNGFQYKAQLNRDIGAFDKNGVQVFLMPAGTGCIVQKKEVGFRHKMQGE